MKWALWKKTIRDSWILTACAGALLLAFSTLYIYMGSQFSDEGLAVILENLPDIFGKVTPIPLKDLATPLGRIAGLLIDPTLVLTCSLWAVARGSDAVSGEINRGTMEMLLAQPVRRYQVILVQAIVSTACTLLLSATILAGCSFGLLIIAPEEPIALGRYLQGISNVFSLVFCIVGVTTLLSSMDRYRWRTLALGGGFVIVSLIVKVLSRLSDRFEWMRYGTIFGAFEPWWLIDAAPSELGFLWLCLNGTLLGIGLAAFLLATVIFCKRDIPAPL